MSGTHRRNKRKRNQLLGILACIAGLLALAGVIFFAINKVMKGNFFAKAGETEYVAYDFEDVVLDEYEAPLGGAGDLGEVTRYRVNIIATPGDAGTVTSSRYVTKGGSLTVEVKDIKDGYEFDGWYIDGVRVSQDTNYYIVGITADMTAIAKFSVDMIDITTRVGSADRDTLHPGGGIVTGGGSLKRNSGESCVIKAVPAEGFEFAYFQVDDDDMGGKYNSPELQVIASSSSSESGLNVDKDTVITAVFHRKKRVITTSVVPAAGEFLIHDDTSGGYKWSIIAENGIDSVDLKWKIPETFVQKTGDDGKPINKRRYELDYINVVQYGLSWNKIDVSGSPLEGSRTLSNSEFPAKGDFEIYLVLKPEMAQDQGTFCAAGIAVPINAGVVTGTGSSTLISTYNLKATPNEGYKFDHWEWYDERTFRTATTSEIMVTPKGYVTYKAFFVPAYYNISLASADPMEGGSIFGLGNVVVDSKGLASTTITVKATSGYEPDTGTYNMGGKSYPISFKKDESDSSIYTFTIANITDDVSLNIKYKKNIEEATVTLWDDTRNATLNKVGFGADADSLKELNISKSVTLSTSATSTTPSATVTLYAKEEGTYKFKQWVSSNGNIIPAGTGAGGLYSTDVTVTGDVSYYAQFEQNKYTIEVEADPATYSATLANKVNIYYDGTGAETPVDKGNKDDDVSPGSSRRLVATPATGKHFLYWTNSSGTKFSGVTDTSSATHANTLIINNINWSDKYTAHFVDDHLEVGVDVSDPDAGTAQLNDKAPVTTYTTYNDIPYEETIYLKAVPKSGYRFVRWDIITYDGLKQENRVSYSEPSISLVYINQDVDCVAVFEKGDYTIKVTSAPVAGGKATANGMSDQAEVDEGAKVTLEATPNTGYTFDYWTDSAGNRYTDNPYTIDSVNGNDTFTAHFKSPQIRVTIQPSKDGAGTVQLDDNPAVSEKMMYTDVVNGSTVLLKAVPANGYKFVRWEAYSESSNKTTAYGDANTVITDLREDTTFTAVFSDSSYTVKVVSNPVSGGKTFVNDKFDSADFMPGESATLEAMPESGYRFDYWTDSAGNKYTQNPYTLTSVNGNETYTAHFVNGKVQITVKNMPDDASYLLVNGKKVSSGATVEFEAGENVILTAEDVNSQQYKFERWESNSGKIYTTNPLNLVNVTQSETYTAVYNSTEKQRGITVLSSPASGGKATKTVDRFGNGAILKAVANPGYYFVSWSRNNVVFSNMPEVMVFDLSDGVVYKAIFAKDKNYDAKSDIILEHFYNDKRLFTDPNYSVTREQMEADAKARIEAERGSQYKDSTPGLKHYKAVSDAEEIFDDIELKEDMSVVMLDSELITTNGEIMPLTLVADRSKEETAAQEFTEKKYGKRYTYEIVACKDVGIPEGFEDGIRTYIWKYQNIHSKDNIYILYEGKDGKMDWVSCTVDAGDSLKFTIDSIGSGVRMTIVKVIIE